ncbi:MAG: glycosyltransferase [Phycisphaerae bacterium]|nr:glycosyltransferase [Phycisphaerae bacterium]
MAATLSRYLAERHECRLIVFDTRRTDYPYGGELIDLRLPEPPPGSTWGRVIRITEAVRALRQVRRRLGLEAVFSFNEPANLPNVLTRSPESRAIPVIGEDKRYGQVGGLRRMAGDWLIRRYYGRADRIVAASKGARETLIDKYGLDGANIDVIYNSIDPDAIAAAAAKPLTETEAALVAGPTIISAGRLTRAKGQWHLLRAMVEVRRRMPEAKLLILGEGELGGYLRDLATKLGLSDCAHFLGFQPNPHKFISRASVFALSSLWEGFGMVVLESLAAGTAVVATDVRSGPREILAPTSDFRRGADGIEQAHYGLLTATPDGVFHGADVPPTPEERMLAEAILRLLSDHSLRNSYSARGPVRAADFRADKLLPEYERSLQRARKC